MLKFMDTGDIGTERPDREDPRLASGVRRRSWTGTGILQTGADADPGRMLSLLRGTLEATADGILIVDSNGRMVGWNRPFMEMWGLPAEVVATRDDAQALSFVLDQLVEPQTFLRTVHELYGSPEADSRDELRFKDGRVVERFSRPQWQDDHVTGRVWSFRDVTAARRTEARLAELLRREQLIRQEAEAAVRVRDEFLAVASHELRTPVTSLLLAMQGLSRLARDGGLKTAAPEMLGEALLTSERQAHKLSKLVSDLVLVSRIQAGQLRLVPREADLTQVVRATVAAHEDQLAAAGCPVALEAPHPLPGRFDAERVADAVGNLLGNALRYGVGQPIVVRVIQKDGDGLVSIHDLGTGIPADQQAQIFTCFGRASSPRHYGGLGLGLYVVQKVAEAHGGSVVLESSPGQGSVFTLRLPLAGPVDIGEPPTAERAMLAARPRAAAEGVG